MLSDGMVEYLMEEAKKASLESYSKYSNFSVGAAVLTINGDIYIGTNVENAAYGSTICAERVAICNAISNGDRNFKAIAIYTSVNSTPPCGACRQFMIEFGEDIIIIFKDNGEIIQKTISELLPFKFSL